MSCSYSSHIFLFPFRFDKIIEPINDRHSYYAKYSFDQRVRERFKEIIDSLKKSGWSYSPYEVKSEQDYNTLIYFYDFVKDSLFNTQSLQELNATSYRFIKECSQNALYTFTFKETTYSLQIKKIELFLFDTGIGVLAFFLENNQYSTLKDILIINNVGRRVYPQFLPLEETQEVFLPKSFNVCGIQEDFKEWKIFPKEAKVARFILKILGDSFTIQKNQESKFFIQPIIDDRMFVICWYGNNILSNYYKTCSLEHIQEWDNWYKLLFVDSGDKTIQHNEMQRILIERSTYFRWQNYGTLYGLTRYSFVALTDRSRFSLNVLRVHMETIYFYMVLLLFAQRASIIRFSDEVTAISDLGDSNRVDNINRLYINFLRFTNKLYFKEVTAQEQGIELYDMGRSIMRIDEGIEDLRNEIGSLVSHALILNENKENQKLNKLTKLGTYFLPPSLIAGIFGMNVFNESIQNIWWMVIAFLAIFFSPFLVKRIISDKDHQ